MLQIKTIWNRLENATLFDDEVNAALRDGWTLKREPFCDLSASLSPLTLICYCTQSWRRRPLTMTLNDYQKAAERTSGDLTSWDKVRNGCYGLNGEAGECIDILKKTEFQGHDFDPMKMVDELGDVLWYVAQLATGLGVTLEYVAQHNVDKLLTRYPDGFDSEKVFTERSTKMPDCFSKSEMTDFLNFMKLPNGTSVVSDDMMNYLMAYGFFTAPASTKYHGNYEGGLLNHSRMVTEYLWRSLRPIT